MKVTQEQLIKGIVDYADNEVIRNLPTTAKWLVGTYIGLASVKAESIMNAIRNNAMIRAMDVVDDNGLIDADLVIDALKQSADRYGRLTIDGLGIGSMTFDSADVENLRRYIER